MGSGLFLMLLPARPWASPFFTWALVGRPPQALRTNCVVPMRQSVSLAPGDLVGEFEKDSVQPAPVPRPSQEGWQERPAVQALNFGEAF